jgi:phenylacetaldehyde dehydrogenase
MSEQQYRLVIGGEPVEGAGSYEVVNPATEQVVALAPEASVDQANAAVDAAADAFGAWSRTTPEERAELLDRAADLIDAHRDEIVPVLQAETGATMRVAKTMQFPQAAARLRRYAKGALEDRITPLPPAVMPTTALAPGGLISAVANRAPSGWSPASPRTTSR